MFSTRASIAGIAAATLLVGAGAATAVAEDVPSLEEVRSAEVEADVAGPEDHLLVFSADARINGHRVQEEWYFAFGVNPEWPHFASLWLLTDPDTDEWIPLCFGFFAGDEDGSIFLGESLHGDDGDGCAMVGLGDEGEVFFSAIELEGDEVLTAAMYALG